MTPDCKFSSRLVEASVNSDIAIARIDEFCHTITKRTVVVIDNAPIHRGC